VTLTPEERRALVGIARAAVAAAVGGLDAPAAAASGRLAAPGAAFVTLTYQGELRGCIGVLDGDRRSLADAVAYAARAAAADDTRFPAIGRGELAGLSLQISVLGPLVRIHARDDIVIGRHGLLVRAAGHSGLLLPQVARERQWDRETFLEQTCHKAGLPPDAWRRGTQVFTFEAEVFGDGPETAAGSAGG
jgi:AmmeMemoRadiSam system protein A